MLFTDPDRGYVCLGSDAPLGGPTKLLRKVICLPPTCPSLKDPQSRLWPGCYTAGNDLKWGVRIVAAYNDGRIILYSIPADVFERVSDKRRGPDPWDDHSGVVAQSDLAMDLFMQSAADDTEHISWYETNAAREAAETGWQFTPDSIWMRGVEIARMDEGDMVKELAVNTDFGGLKIWAFMLKGVVKMWSLAGPPEMSRDQRWVVGTNGILYKCEHTGDDTSCATHPESSKGKEKETEAADRHIHFQGLDGANEDVLIAPDYGSLEAERGGVVKFNAAEYLELMRRRRRLHYCRPEHSCGYYGIHREPHERVELEILTDWRNQQLLDVRPSGFLLVRLFASYWFPY